MANETAAEREWERMNREIEKRDERIAHLTQRCEELDVDAVQREERIEEARNAESLMRVERDQWRAERLPDREAEMISGCTRAIERYHQQMREDQQARPYANTGFVSSATGWSRTGGGWQQPEALGDPVGRVLLALAARYGLAIEAVPAVESTAPAAADLASAIQRCLNDFPFPG